MNRRRVQAAGTMLGLAGLVAVVVATADDVDGTVRPSWPAFGAACALALASLLGAGRSWASVVDAGRHRREVLGALYLSQLSKYLPAGGLFQAAGQVSMSAGGSIPVARAAVAYPIAMLEVVVAGAILSSGLALQTDLPSWVRVLAAVAPLSVISLHPRMLRTVLGVGRRISRRVPDATVIPPVGRLVTSTAWALVNMASTSAAFTVLLRSIAPDASLLGAYSGFAAAWVIGFLVVPLPSGLGVREATLLLAVPGLAPAEILAASLAHRIATVLAEVIATAGNAVTRRRSARPARDEAVAEGVPRA